MQDVTDLALRAATGDRDATAEWVKATITDIRRYCSAIVDPSSADDLTQETYLRAIPALRGYRGEAPAAAWLLAIARHTCIDEIRQRKRRLKVVDLSLIIEPGHSEDIAQQITIGSAINSLLPDRREAFVLTQVLGLSYAEAADTIGCPIGTVRSRVFRARADLIDALRESTVKAGHPGR